MYSFNPSNKFNKSLQKVRKHKKYKDSEFIIVLDTLLAGEVLPKKYKNHKLSGEYEGCFECHIQNDILLIYFLDEVKRVLYAVDIGDYIVSCFKKN